MHFKTVALIGRYQDSGLDAPLRKLAATLQAAGCKVLIEADTAKNTGITEHDAASYKEIGEQADLAVVMGGDGTMLGAARQLACSHVPLIGINHGRLGFITDIPFIPPMMRWPASSTATLKPKSAYCLKAMSCAMAKPCSLASH